MHGVDSKENANDAGLESRQEFVRSKLENVFAFTPRNISPIAYQEGFPFDYNNFVYAVEVDRQEHSRDEAPRQPGTFAMPAVLSTFIFRMPNPRSEYNDKVRVENEVAALWLAREALTSDKLGHLVPRVFGWASAKDGGGWILMELMSGEPMAELFNSEPAEDKTIILEQMADVLACFQRFSLSDVSIEQFGGLEIGENGTYESAPLPTFNAGPFTSYEEFIRCNIESELEKADADPRLLGWRNNYLREALDEFLNDGLPRLLQPLSSYKPQLVHGDFSVDNVLYDRSTKKLTAVLDFDSAHIGTVADEFLRSLGHGIGCFPHTRDGNEEMVALRLAMMTAFSEPLPANTEQVDWVAAKTWDAALRKRNLQRPGTIPGMEILADIFWLSTQILPFELCNEVVVQNSTEDQLVRRKFDGEVQLDRFLIDYGFRGCP